MNISAAVQDRFERAVATETEFKNRVDFNHALGAPTFVGDLVIIGLMKARTLTLMVADTVINK